MLIGTAGTVIAIPIWILLYRAIGVEGFAAGVDGGDDLVRLCAVWSPGVSTRGGTAVQKVASPRSGRCSRPGSQGASVALPLITACSGPTRCRLLEGLVMAVIGGVTVLAVFSVTSLCSVRPS